MLVAFPDAVHRFLSTLSVVAAASYLGFQAHVLSWVTFAVTGTLLATWLLERRILSERVAAAAKPVGYGLAVGLFGVLLLSFGWQEELLGWLHEALSRDADARDAPLGVAATLCFAFALAGLSFWIIRTREPKRSPLAFGVAALAIAVLAGVTRTAPGVMAAMLTLALAFDRRERPLMALSIIFLLFFGSAFYYALSATLLQKAGVLVGSGLLLLALRYVMDRFWLEAHG
jgi:hypothetical protein